MNTGARQTACDDEASPAAATIERAALEQELREFSSIVAHDLGASFRHLAEFSRLLLGEPTETLTDRQRGYAEHIRAASLRCQVMMEQLAVYSRVQHKSLAPIGQDAALAARLALMQLAGSVRAAGAKVSVEPLGEAYADPELFGLALRHLLDNAVKFPRPHIPPRVRVVSASGAAAWGVRIVDNGVGVEPAYRDRAFQMFRRVQPRDDHPGVGAGLAICRRIARRHGGEVRFLNVPEGACVEMILPHAPARQ